VAFRDALPISHTALRQTGVEVAREPAEMESRERMASVLDPDGNEILLGRPAA
jgi:hypothetical protein